MTPRDAVSSGNESLTRTALLLAGAAVFVMVVLTALDHDGPVWLLQPALGLAAAVTAWRAGGSSPRNMAAFAALIVGTLMVLIFLAWLIGEAT